VNRAVPSSNRLAAVGLIAALIGHVHAGPAPTKVLGASFPSSALIQWSAVSGATDYVINYKASAASTWSTFADGVSTRRGVSISSLVDGTAYDFRVSSVVAGVVSVPSTVLSLTPGSTPDPNVLRHILSTGQSLSIGSNGAPALTTVQPYNNRMLASGNGSLIPLVEPGPGGTDLAETMGSAMANHLRFLAGSEYRSVVTMHGVGGTAYSGLKKGTTPYSNGQNQQSAAFNLAQAENRAYLVQAVTTVHGENDEADHVSAVDYAGFLEEWQADYEADAKALTGQSGVIPLFTCQMSSWMRYYSKNPTTALGQLKAARENPTKIFLVTPKYIFDYADFVHIKNHGYRRLGEYYGKVMKKVLVDRQPWLPLSPTAITRNGKTITARFHVPVPPLKFDTSAVLETPHFGFEYHDSVSSARIRSVRISGPDTVTIQLDQVPTGADGTLAYAFTGDPYTAAGRYNSTAARGNLRDSDPTPSSSFDANIPVSMGGTLPNWCMTFNDPITVSAVAPPVLTAGSGISGTINLAWTATSGASGYQVQRATSPGGPYSTIIALGPGSLSHADAGLVATTPYFYSITAVHPDGDVSSNEAVAASGGRAAASLTWSGGLSSGAWDFTTNNWLRGATASACLAGDAVTFANAPAGLSIRPTVPVFPASMAFTNTSSTLSLISAQSAFIGGRASLTKSGAGTVNIAPLANLVSLAASTLVANNEVVTVSSTANLVPGMCVSEHSGGLRNLSTVVSIIDATRFTIAPTPAAAKPSTTLYFGMPHTFDGGTYLAGGTLIMGSVHANQHGLGTGPVVFQGGTLTMYSPSTNGAGVMRNPVIVETTGKLNAAQRCDLEFPMTGTGTLDLGIPFIRTELKGDWSKFTGRVNVTTTNATEGEFRINNLFDMPMAAIALGNKVNANHVIAVPPEGIGFSIGEVAGVAGSFLKGAPTINAGRIFTYTVGGKNTDATFAGIITEQAAGATTAIRKTGSGTWTLSGANTHTGSTTVAAGKLKISSPGSITNSAAMDVLSGGTLEMAGGSLATGPVSILAGGTLKGSGAVKGPVINDGLVLGTAQGTPAINGNLINNGTVRLTEGSTISVSGTFTNNGVLNIIGGSQNLPANFVNNGVVMDDSLLQPVQTTIAGGVFTASILSQNGFIYQVQRCADLINPTWVNAAPSKPGNGSVISFSVPVEPQNPRGLFRISIAP
jgi:autotransporter-associated beta strand protein